MKQIYRRNKDLLDSLLILLAIGGLTGLFCTSKMTNTQLTHYSSMLSSALVMPEDIGQFFLQQSLSHVLFCLLLFFLGFSLFGIPLIQFCVFLKGFQLGFSAYLFVAAYQMKGILGILLTLLPQIVLDSLAISVIAVASIQCSGTLLSALCEHHHDVKLLSLINQKLSSLLVSCALSLASSAFKSTIGLFLIDLYMKLD